EQLAPDPEMRAILLEALVEIDRRLDGLPLPVRKAFLLSQLDGMTQPQIAAELGLSLATVQRYIVKAMHRCFFHGAARTQCRTGRILGIRQACLDRSRGESCLSRPGYG